MHGTPPVGLLFNLSSHALDFGRKPWPAHVRFSEPALFGPANIVEANSLRHRRIKITNPSIQLIF
jgi:hypothetical protein